MIVADTVAWVTAVATAVLAVFAIVAANVAWHALGAERANLKTAQDQLKGSQRPLVVPFTAEHPKVVEGRYSADNILEVAIDNIGPGMGLGITAKATLLDATGRQSPNATGDVRSVSAATLPGAAAARPPTNLRLRASGWGEGACFRLQLDYQDVSGLCWRTTAAFYGDPPQWREITPDGELS
jgi:hypothetical protein